MALQVYNTLTKRKEVFVPLESGKIKLYVCGVTVYDLCHIGHARSAIVFDVIYRYLTHRGYEVTYVRNFTDIDDKIIRRANQEQTDFRTIADRYIKAFREDMTSLGVLNPDVEPLATEHIAEMIEMIRILMDKGYAYQAGTDVYFEIERFPDYGKLSGQSLEEMLAGARVEVSDHKRNPLDFALWKGSKPGEPAWPSPWGPGRPGWHIECSTMAKCYLGITIDIHGGGKDLIFPHHENEIAQSEAAHDATFARYWLHNGFVNINNEKMSKSLGNFLTIRDILRRSHPESLRLFVLSKHYRSPVDFSEQALAEADRALERIYRTLEAVETRATPDQKVSEKALMGLDKELFERIEQFPDRFIEAMDSDFNTAQAIGLVFDLQRHLQRFLDRFGSKKLKGPAAILAHRAGEAIKQHSQILGLINHSPKEFLDQQRKLKVALIGLTVDEIESLIAKRSEARRRKEFKEADRIREDLARKGVILEDTPQGTRWRVKTG